MKIVFFSAVFLPKWVGGTEIATYNIAQGLAARGHEVHVVTSWDPMLPHHSFENGFYIHRLKHHKIRFLGVFLFWVKVCILLKKINPSIMVAQSIENGLSSAIYRYLSRTPYIVWGQGSDVYGNWPFKKPISRVVLKHAAVILALTEDMKKEIRKAFSFESEIIGNGIDLKRFSIGIARSETRRMLGISAEIKLIVFVGRLQLVKGLEYLIKAMSILTNTWTDVRLLLVGDGQERAALEKMVEAPKLVGHVIFAGEIPNTEVAYYMSAGDIFVLPSLSEGLPIVILEAMASGLPVVASSVGGIPSLITDGENGFLVSPKNPEQLADRLDRLLVDAELRKKFSDHNLAKVKGYSLDSVIDKLEMVCKEVISK